MGTIGVCLAALGLAVAVATTDASSHSPWYCYRLAPKFITSAVTPCTFPCLFISPNVHPHIVLQPEHDGTPCHVAPSLHHKSQVGRCRRGVCTANLRPAVLKRKKRFVCLITLAALMRARRERKNLKEQMENLRRLTLYNHMRSVNRGGGSGAGNRILANTRTGATGREGANAADVSAIEIHIEPGVGNGGTVTDNLGRVVSPPFVSGSNSAGRIPGINTINGVPRGPGAVFSGGRGAGHTRTGSADDDFGSPGLTDTNAGGSVGSAAYVSGAGGSRNYGFGNTGVGESLGGNSGVATGISESEITGNDLNGGRGGSVSVTNVAAAAGRRNGLGGSSATVVSLAGVRATSRGRGMGANGGRGMLNTGGPSTVSRGVVGVGGVFTSRGSTNPNAMNVGVGTIGATSIGSSSSYPGISGVSRAFSGAVGGVTGANIVGSRRRTGATGFASSNRLGAGTEIDNDFEPELRDNGSFNPDITDTDDTEESEIRSGSNTRFRG